jgi:hypothetical protein
MPPSGVYTSEELAMLSRVLDEALKVVVELSGTRLGDEEMEELSSRLGKVIMDHFTAGETDPERLKTIAIESIQGRLS